MTADEQEIRALIAGWARASEAGDLEAIDPLMEPGVLFMTPGNEPFGREAFRQHFERNVKTMRLEVRPEVREVEISGDLAYAQTWLEIRIEPSGGGEPIRHQGFSLTVYRRRPGGRWQLWRDANLVQG